MKRPGVLPLVGLVAGAALGVMVVSAGVLFGLALGWLRPTFPTSVTAEYGWALYGGGLLGAIVGGIAGALGEPW